MFHDHLIFLHRVQVCMQSSTLSLGFILHSDCFGQFPERINIIFLKLQQH